MILNFHQDFEFHPLTKDFFFKEFRKFPVIFEVFLVKTSLNFNVFIELSNSSYSSNTSDACYRDYSSNIDEILSVILSIFWLPEFTFPVISMITWKIRNFSNFSNANYSSYYCRCWSLFKLYTFLVILIIFLSPVILVISK